VKRSANQGRRILSGGSSGGYGVQSALRRDVERGKKSPTLRTVSDFATLFGVRLQSLIARAESLLRREGNPNWIFTDSVALVRSRLTAKFPRSSLFCLVADLQCVRLIASLFGRWKCVLTMSIQARALYHSYQRSCDRRTIRSDGEARIIAAGFFYSLAANEDLKPDEC
jgi:hypothetical protein